jgi:PEGA domain-containing protein
MTLRVVVPLLAICLATPLITNAEQVVKGRGYKPRESGGGQAAEKSGEEKTPTATASAGARDRSTDSSKPAAERSTETRTAERRTREEPRARVDAVAEERSTETRAADDVEPEPERYAVPRNNGYVVNPRPNNRPIVVRQRPDVIYVGSAYARHYAPAQYGYWTRHYYGGSPIGYAPWMIFGSIGYSNFGFYGGPYYYGYNGYGYGPGPYPYPPGGYDLGGIRLKIRPRDAQVFVDGYYAGLVDDFDGMFQALKLEAGGHKIEIHMPGFQDFEMDVHVQPGRTITLNEDLRPRP